MRLFTGIALAPNVIARLSVVLGELRTLASVNWSPPENLHLTCRFIGDWPEARLPQLKAALGAVAISGSIPISLSQLGFFPNPHRPHSFFAGVRSEPVLTDLARTIDHALTALGSTPEARPYKPHITLARIKPANDIRRLQERIEAMTDFDFGSFSAHDFHLYSSQPTAGGSVYTKLATYDLMREKNGIS